MTIALVAHATAAGTNGGTTAAVDTTGATLLLRGDGFYQGSAGSFAITDSKGNSWSLRLSGSSPGALANRLYDVMAGPVVGSGHTAGNSGTNIFSNLFFNAWSGTLFLGGDTGNLTNTAASSQTSSSLPTITTSYNGELIVSALVMSVSSFAGLAVDSGFTILDSLDQSAGNNFAGGFAYLIQGSAGAVSLTWSWTNGTDASGQGSSISSYRTDAANRVVKYAGRWGGYAGSSGGFAG